MLDAFRKRSRSMISNFILLAVAAVMTLWGVDQIGRDGGADGAVAYVNGEPISRREFAQEYEYRLSQYQAMFGGQVDERLLKQLQIPRRTLDEMVQYRLLAQQAKRLGIQVPDEELADFIKSLPYFQKDGKFDPVLYEKVPNRGLEERRQRDRLRVSRFQGYLADRIRMTPTEVRKAFELKETKMDLEFARINFESLAKNQGVSSAEVEAFLKGTSEDELRKAYENRQNDFADPAKVELRQIRAGVPFQATEARRNEAKTKIEEIHKTVTAENFAQLAKQKSDDEYARKGGLVGWIDRGTLESPLEQAIDRLEVGKVSQPIETDFGYYLLLVTQKKERTLKPFEQVKRTLAEALLKDRKATQWVEQTRAEWEKTLAAGQSIQSELKKYKVEIKKTGTFAVGSGYIPQIGQSDEVLDTVFQLTKSSPQAKRLVPLQGDYLYLKLVSLSQPKEQDFEKTREAVERDMVPTLQSAFFQQWLASLQKNAKVKIELKADTADATAEM